VPFLDGLFSILIELLFFVVDDNFFAAFLTNPKIEMILCQLEMGVHSYTVTYPVLETIRMELLLHNGSKNILKPHLGFFDFAIYISKFILLLIRFEIGVKMIIAQNSKHLELLFMVILVKDCRSP
jgi:hypothetical protein